MITTNELRSGTRIKLANGWYGTLLDNRTSATEREAEIDAPTGNTVGDVYAHDIVQARYGGEWMAVTHTAKQAQERRQRSRELFTMHYNDETEAGI